MANISNVEIITEGFKKAVIRFYFESDGVEGEWVNRVIFNPSTDFGTPPVGAPNWDANPLQSKVPQITILQAWTSSSWFDITLGFNGSTPSQELVLARDTDFYLDFRYFGGIKDRASVVPTGELIISTKDFAPAGNNAFLVLEVRKD